MSTSSFLFVASGAIACAALTGCWQEPTVVLDIVEVDGQITDDVGGFKPIREEGTEGQFYIDEDDDLLTTFAVERADTTPVILTLEVSLPEGTFDARDVDLRICACHKLPEHADDLYFCWDDETRICADVEGTMHGTYDASTCKDDPVDCLRELDATFDVGEGGEFFGALRFVHDEAWHTEWARSEW